MQLNKIVFVGIFSIFLSACGEKVYDKTYYADHLDEAKQVVEKCKSGDMSGENCQNAKGAVNDAAMKELLNK